jgi:hypothetical protein
MAHTPMQGEAGGLLAEMSVMLWPVNLIQYAVALFEFFA